MPDICHFLYSKAFLVCKHNTKKCSNLQQKIAQLKSTLTLLLALQLTNINFAVGVLLLLMMMMMRFCNDDGFWLAWFLPYTPDLKKVHQGLRVNGGELAIQENESQLFMDLNPFLVKRNSMEHNFLSNLACYKERSHQEVLINLIESVLRKERSEEYQMDDKIPLTLIFLNKLCVTKESIFFL